MVAMERSWLDVPFGDKDEAKAAGARWDPQARRWYAPQPGMDCLSGWTPLPDLLPGEDRAYAEGLFVDLIPQTSWFRNVRAAVDPTDWDRLRRMVYRRAGHRCEACGDSGAQLEAHERFTYDFQAGVQRLVRLICLCTACHRVTHFGRTMLEGDAAGQAAIDHLQAVTGMIDLETELHIRDAFDLWARRSEVSWRVDLSLISAAGIRVREPEPGTEAEARFARGASRVYEPDEDEPGMLTIRPITRLADITPETPEVAAAWRNLAGLPPKREPGPATQALAASYERYADELAAIEALRSRLHSG
jgi:Domain of unknown function (DUF5710)